MNLTRLIDTYVVYTMVEVRMPNTEIIKSDVVTRPQSCEYHFIQDKKKALEKKIEIDPIVSLEC